jgi:hypothetical protein
MGRVTTRTPKSGETTSRPEQQGPKQEGPKQEGPVARPPTPTPTPKANTSPAAEPATKRATETPAPAPGAPVEPVAETTAGATPEPAPEPTRVTKLDGGSLPVRDYDDATLASVRARLRILTAAQVSQLRDYEQEHAARADFLRMYENRIAKLTSGS